jgi:GH15 family glucan-1,4-alpha-glucosidase
MTQPPIEDYAIVGDCRSAALVSRLGSCDWLCWPRFDSASIFAALLDEERGGCFSIAPSEPFRSQRSYLGETNVLVTRFFTDGAELTLTDFMPVLSPEDQRRFLQPEHELLRLLSCDQGEAEIEIIFDPRPDYGRDVPRLQALGKLGLCARTRRGGILTLLTDAPLGAEGRAHVRLRAGERLCFSLGFTSHDIAILPPSGVRSFEMLERTAALWRSWARRTRYEGPYRDAVVRSALLLKLMQFVPSGAVVAAPTTSLPERPGGDLNWDYRFCWLRDAALSARALFGLGHREEAENFVSWLLTATSLSLPKLHVLYDLFGRQPDPEIELKHLRGYRGARPVRVGNAAMGQVQLDTYGELIEAAAYFVRSGGEIDRTTASALIGFGREVARDWDEPDEGIWEERGPGRDLVHSRALCWAALQRLIELQEKGHLPRAPAARFAEARDRIREEVETLGWSEQFQSYTRTLGGADVDASLLLLPWYGYCDAASPRMQGTWRRIRQKLSLGNALLRRYLGKLTRGEGAFGICSFWAVEFLAAGGGTLREAQEMFAQLLGYANDIGLYAEEIDPETGGGRGNFPQAYTHVGLINAALTMHERAERGLAQEERHRLHMPEACP